MNTVFLHTKHKALWNWLSKDSRRQKGEWPGWKEYPEAVYDSYCFACMYACQIEEELLGTFYSKEDKKCKFCPLEWPSYEGVCISLEGNLLYDQFKKSIGVERQNIARRIRDLPVKPGTRTI